MCLGILNDIDIEFEVNLRFRNMWGQFDLITVFLSGRHSSTVVPNRNIQVSCPLSPVWLLTMYMHFQSAKEPLQHLSNKEFGRSVFPRTGITAIQSSTSCPSYRQSGLEKCHTSKWLVWGSIWGLFDVPFLSFRTRSFACTNHITLYPSTNSFFLETGVPFCNTCIDLCLQRGQSSE